MDRFNECVKIISYLTNIPCERAKKIVLKTLSGQAILEKNEAFLYEQTTDNVYSIIRELKKNDKKFENITPKDISEAYLKIR